MSNSVQAIRDLNIVDVISNYITLEKHGATFKANCPFHDEKTPSFNVSPAKGIYNCFGCGKKGDAINFVQEYRKIDFKEAVKEICLKHSIEFSIKGNKADNPEQIKIKESILLANKAAADWFYSQAACESFQEYIYERDFLDPALTARFQIGFAPSGSRNLYEVLKTQFAEETLLAAGLIHKTEHGKIYDYFQERIMFPIFDNKGQIIAFSGRYCGKDKEQAKTFKYKNSPETAVYSKAKILYGLFQAKDSILKHNQANLVEGNFDVLRLHQAGVYNTVATCGTALTQFHIAIFKMYCKNVTLIYDGDSAGQKAILKAAVMFIESGINVSVFEMGQKQDPDDFFRAVNCKKLTVCPKYVPFLEK